MRHTYSPRAFSSTPSGVFSTCKDIITPDGLIIRNKLSPRGRKQLEHLLVCKLRGVPTGHLPDLRLSDILQQKPRTQLLNIPRDINLAWFLENRARVDEYLETDLENRPLDLENKGEERGRGDKQGGCGDEKVARAAWYYRLDPVHQFQRYHDAVRWNHAIYVALLTQHTLSKDRRSRRGPRDVELELSPTAIRFMSSFLEAVLEHHSSSSSASFTKRDEFIALWQTTNLDLFTIRKSWAKKAPQRALKQLSSEWEAELSYARRSIGSDAYESTVGRFVGSLVPGRAVAGRTSQTLASSHSSQMEGRDVYWRRREEQNMEAETREEGNELLDALRVPFPSSAPGKHSREPLEEEVAMVCDLRAAITSVQNTRPGDMLPLLLRLFPFCEIEA